MGRQQVSVLAATRVHFPQGTERLPEVTVTHLKKFALTVQDLGIDAAIAVNSLEAQVHQVLAEAGPDVVVKVLHVPVWGAFVPALNTLLGEAQARGHHYIMYQSLEVCTSREVVKRLLDHFTADTLVVGPVLDGHCFSDGEQPLNGRTSPWNTLALWKVRKLAMTGFLNIADGLAQTRRPDFPLVEDQTFREWSGDVLPAREYSVDVVPATDIFDCSTMGSQRWWQKDRGAATPFGIGSAMRRQVSQGALAIPAGVEEVTAIALLQHILGCDRARAVLVRLPQDLLESVSWDAKWAGDVQRQAWHEYKMASKVTRPAAQIRQLFGSHRWRWKVSLSRPLLPTAVSNGLTPPGTPGGAGSGEEDPALHFGVVQHYSDSIRPPLRVEIACYVSIALFSANFTAAFAAAFRTLSVITEYSEAWSMELFWLGLQISGVFLPMPLSLWLTRLVVSVFDHYGGLAFFALSMLFSHILIVCFEARGTGEDSKNLILLISRLLAGLGSGVQFQARFVLASLSTMDHHPDLQARQLLASDIGLALGALLPWLSAKIAGSPELSRSRPEYATSVVLAILSTALFLWIFAAFPKTIHRLPDRIRFLPLREASANSLGAQGMAALLSADTEALDASWRTRLILSGTLRVSVQSSVVVALALWMKCCDLTDSFVRSKAIGFLLLLPAPLEAVAAGIARLPHWIPCDWLQERAREASIATVCVVACVMLGNMMLSSENADQISGENQSGLASSTGTELAGLLAALAVAKPLHASRLYALKDAEEAIVTLEWLKAYVGRIIGPYFALMVQVWFGYDTLLIILCLATVVVALTA